MAYIYINVLITNIYIHNTTQMCRLFSFISLPFEFGRRKCLGFAMHLKCQVVNYLANRSSIIRHQSFSLHGQRNCSTTHQEQPFPYQSIRMYAFVGQNDERGSHYSSAIAMMTHSYKVLPYFHIRYPST
jgi:hypothetical protein